MFCAMFASVCSDKIKCFSLFYYNLHAQKSFLDDVANTTKDVANEFKDAVK